MISRTFSRALRTSSSSLSASRTGPARSIHALVQGQPLSSKLPAPVRARIATRWYSDAAKASEAEKDKDAAKAEEKTDGAPPADSAKAELEAKNKEIVNLKDQYLRSVADFRNLQERTKRDMQAAKDFAIQKFARDLIETVDTFDLALLNVPADKLASNDEQYKELKQLHGGLQMTESILMNTLKKHGLERFDPSENGDKFDPNIHEATFQTPQPDKEDGTCFHTTQKGFRLNGRTIRAAKVGVVKNS